MECEEWESDEFPCVSHNKGFVSQTVSLSVDGDMSKSAMFVAVQLTYKMMSFSQNVRNEANVLRGEEE